MSGSNTDRARQGANHLTPLSNEPIVNADGRPTTTFMQSYQRLMTYMGSPGTTTTGGTTSLTQQIINLSNTVAGGVTSVAGRTGAITLTHYDIGDWSFATTGFIPPVPSTTLPLVDGVAAVGTSLEYARGDHVHPSDNEWNAGTVTALGANLTLSFGTLSATDTNGWTATAVTAIGANLVNSGGTLDLSKNPVVTTIEANLNTGKAETGYAGLFINDGYGYSFRPRVPAKTFNQLNAADDQLLLFGGATADTGAFTLAGWTTTSTQGLRIDQPNKTIEINLGASGHLKIVNLPTADPGTKDGAVWVDTTAGNTLKISL